MTKELVCCNFLFIQTNWASVQSTCLSYCNCVLECLLRSRLGRGVSKTSTLWKVARVDDLEFQIDLTLWIFYRSQCFQCQSSLSRRDEDDGILVFPVRRFTVPLSQLRSSVFDDSELDRYTRLFLPQLA